jgi:hypothetical protein
MAATALTRGHDLPAGFAGLPSRGVKRWDHRGVDHRACAEVAIV